MTQDQEQTFKQVLKLVLTPDLRQSLAILQMSLMELETYISQQLLENCLLELEDINPEEIPDQDNLIESFALSPLEPKDIYGTNADNSQTENDDLFEGNLPAETSKNVVQDSVQKSYANLKTAGPSIQDYLLSQLNLTSYTEQEKSIAEYLIGNIDVDGYLRSKTDCIAKLLKIPVEEVEDLLRRIQTFDPPGAGARSLKECLLIQLDSQNDCFNGTKSPNRDLLEIAKVIVEDHLYDLAHGKVCKISALLKRPLKDVQEAIVLIKKLDPKPGRNFGDPNDLRFVLPDVSIKKSGNEYSITV